MDGFFVLPSAVSSGTGSASAHLREGIEVFTGQSMKLVTFVPVTTMTLGSPQTQLVNPNPPVLVWVENVTTSSFEIHASASFSGQVRWAIDGTP